jgi:hypothetical protein
MVMTSKGTTPPVELDYPGSQEDRLRHAQETGADTESLHELQADPAEAPTSAGKDELLDAIRRNGAGTS